MRGKLAKQIRRVTANPGLAPVEYEAVHVKTVHVVNHQTKTVNHVHKYMQVLSNQCQRFYYQHFKKNVKRLRSGMQPRSLLK